MTYRVIYGDGLAIEAAVRRDNSIARSQRYSTEHEAMTRAREILDQNDRHAVAICDPSGHAVGGVLLQLKLGSCTD
jgi:hypothetical protein